MTRSQKKKTPEMIRKPKKINLLKLEQDLGLLPTPKSTFKTQRGFFL
jgi:hypothetical protein